MGLDVTKPVFGVSDKAKLKMILSAIEILLVCRLEIILKKVNIKDAVQSAQMHRLIHAGGSATLLLVNRKDRFSGFKADII